MKRLLLGMTAIALLLTPVACDDDDDLTDPTMASLAGDWVASGNRGSFTLTVAGVETDLLDEGGFVELTLEADGAASGRLLAPGADEDGGDFDATFDGTWTLDEDDGDFFVQLDHEEDTFLRDVEFAVQGNDRLVADDTFQSGLVRIRLTLVRD